MAVAVFKVNDSKNYEKGKPNCIFLVLLWALLVFISHCCHLILKLKNTMQSLLLVNLK